MEICGETREALGSVSGWDRAAHIFWLLGPFILLVERSPADMWLSVIALSFAVRSILRREGWWLNVTWVRLAFLFWATCLLSAFLSPLPAYSIGEAFVWFRFPLFAMAVAFWLGRDERMINAMLLSIGIGMMAMCVILAAETFMVGANEGRLSWPYGDLVPGNYLAKACLPAFVVVVAIATSSNGRTASWAAIIAIISIVASVMTGERVNFLIRACSGMLAAIAWRPRLYCVIAIFAVGGLAMLTAIISTPHLVQRFVEDFFSNFQPMLIARTFVRWRQDGWPFRNHPCLALDLEICDCYAMISSPGRHYMIATLIRIIFTSRCLVKPVFWGY